MRRALRGSVFLLLLAALAPAGAQESGAARLHALVNGLTVTPRVLIVGARPSDADADLIAWLARGRHVQTGYLSLTRGESAPNYTGLESGATLGAVRVHEALAARRIDGGEQYFTFAYDVGFTRSTADFFEQVDRTTLLGDVVAVVRAFRPHVIVARFRSDTLDGDAQRQVSAMLAREAFDAAIDTVRFPSKGFGMPWTPTSVYEPGAGVSIDAREWDRMLGRRYADIATESRAQLRSFGFPQRPWDGTPTSEWRRVATRASASAASNGASLFDGVDTTFARLHGQVPRETVHNNATGVTAERPMITQLPAILAYADSARVSFSLERPAAAMPYLRRLADLAAAARRGIVGCNHPARDAVMSLRGYRACRPEWLDLDASLDLVQRRANDALLAASGVTFTALADREFLASGDSAIVTITVFNNSDESVLLNDVSVSGAASVRMSDPIMVPAHASASVRRAITSIAYAHPW